MKNFLELCKKRYSVRRYLPRKVPRKIILKCIESARLAPSAENKQPWRFLVIDEKPLLSQLKEKAFSGIFGITKWAKTAPVIIVVLTKMDFITHRLGALFQRIEYHLIDIGIATEHLILQATELGLGSCWVGWFNLKNTKKVLNIPSKYKIAALVTMGYIDTQKQKNVNKTRKKIEEIVWFNQIRG